MLNQDQTLAPPASTVYADRKLTGSHAPPALAGAWPPARPAPGASALQAGPPSSSSSVAAWPLAPPTGPPPGLAQGHPPGPAACPDNGQHCRGEAGPHGKPVRVSVKLRPPTAPNDRRAVVASEAWLAGELTARWRRSGVASPPAGAHMRQQLPSTVHRPLVSLTGLVSCNGVAVLVNGTHPAGHKMPWCALKGVGVR